MSAKKKGKTLAQVFTEDAERPGTAAWFDMAQERYGDLLKMDGYDDCVIGLSHQFNKTTILYDKEKVITKLEKEYMRCGADFSKSIEDRKSDAEESAQEWFDFNMIGAWMGDTTPAFFTES